MDKVERKVIMTKEEFMKKLEEDEEFSPGWQAIDDAFDEMYPDLVTDMKREKSYM